MDTTNDSEIQALLSTVRAQPDGAILLPSEDSGENHNMAVVGGRGVNKKNIPGVQSTVGQEGGRVVWSNTERSCESAYGVTHQSKAFRALISVLHASYIETKMKNTIWRLITGKLYLGGIAQKYLIFRKKPQAAIKYEYCPYCSNTFNKSTIQHQLSPNHCFQLAPKTRGIFRVLFVFLFYIYHVFLSYFCTL